MLVISIPLAVMLLALVVYGIMAVVGFLLLLLVGLIFLLFWMIPGRMRSIGMRWFEALIGTLLQAIIITALLGGVMVLAGIFNAALNKYGLFMVGLLNVATMAMVFKVRGMFENMTGFASPAGGSAMSGYAAMKLTAGISQGTQGTGQGQRRDRRFRRRKGDGWDAGRGQPDHGSELRPVEGGPWAAGSTRAGAPRRGRAAIAVPGPRPDAATDTVGRPMAAATPYALAGNSRTAIGANAYGPTATPMAPPVPAALPAGAPAGPKALPAAVSNSTTKVPGGSGAERADPGPVRRGSAEARPDAGQLGRHGHRQTWPDRPAAVAAAAPHGRRGAVTERLDRQLRPGGRGLQRPGADRVDLGPVVRAEPATHPAPRPEGPRPCPRRRRPGGR